MAFDYNLFGQIQIEDIIERPKSQIACGDSVSVLLIFDNKVETLVGLTYCMNSIPDTCERHILQITCGISKIVMLIAVDFPRIYGKLNH